MLLTFLVVLSLNLLNQKLRNSMLICKVKATDWSIFVQRYHNYVNYVRFDILNQIIFLENKA